MSLVAAAFQTPFNVHDIMFLTKILLFEGTTEQKDRKFASDDLDWKFVFCGLKSLIVISKNLKPEKV